jgi:hypothetical protein
MSTPVVASPAGTSTPRSANQVGPGQINDQVRPGYAVTRDHSLYVAKIGRHAVENLCDLPSFLGEHTSHTFTSCISPWLTSLKVSKFTWLRTGKSAFLGSLVIEADSQQRPNPPIRVASAHPSLVNIPIMDSPVPSPRVRPKSIHGTGVRLS